MALQLTGKRSSGRFAVEEGGNARLYEGARCACTFCISQLNEGRSSVVTEEDLKHLWQNVEMRDVGPSRRYMMDRSTPNVRYQAMRRDPKAGFFSSICLTISQQNCLRAEDATSKRERALFWDDEFRPKWNDMLAFSATIEECLTFPFFCGDREYIIGRRIGELDGSFNCVTKGTLLLCRVAVALVFVSYPES
ncbi:uncharacterized protein LOC111274143 [Durio zibethinus]|uniref:Uncharacterized protein LOC111274143 n=1 Tax=Durio zibethinus TaxID=66656 RepID=A0A6P5WEM4_DURZI|nr:uncharacterized protein LOC111274143 [Durio zibethinus]